jgi:hypothetical protein
MTDEIILFAGNQIVTEDRLVRSRWTFGFKDGEVITRSFFFGYDGLIKVFRGMYEHSWKLENGVLKIFDKSGHFVNTYEIMSLRNERLTLVANHMADQSRRLYVYLEESDDISGISEATRSEQTRNPSKTFRAAAVTMVYNESYFLPLWFQHYGAQLGYENLYVIDHGSTDDSVNVEYCNRIRIPRDEFDDETRAAMISTFHKTLLHQFDVVIYTDCDEFIVPRPSKFSSLTDYLKRRPSKAVRCVGINVVQDMTEAPALDLKLPILKQRPYGFATHWYFKPLISSIPIKWEAGFHYCDVEAPVDPDVWLFHLKLADEQKVIQRDELMRTIAWTKGRQSNVPTSERTREFLERLRNGRDNDFFERSIDFQSFFDTSSSGPLARIPSDFISGF